MESGHIEMTMAKAQHIAASQFKAECLALLDRVAETGESLIVTKHGRPVAQLVPLPKQKNRSLLGSVTFVGDILSPIDEDWDANR